MDVVPFNRVISNRQVLTHCQMRQFPMDPPGISECKGRKNARSDKVDMKCDQYGDTRLRHGQSSSRAVMVAAVRHYMTSWLLCRRASLVSASVVLLLVLHTSWEQHRSCRSWDCWALIPQWQVRYARIAWGALPHRHHIMMWCALMRVW
jgi:hypothetical protein